MWAKEPCIRWGRDHPREAAMWGLFGPLKSIGSLCCGVCSKTDYSVLNNGMTPRLQYSRLVGVALHHPPWKIRPMRCGLSSKLFDHLLLFHQSIVRYTCAAEPPPPLASCSQSYFIFRLRRLHAVHEMRPIATDVAVCLYAVSVGHTGDWWAVQKRLDRSRCRWRWLRWVQGTMY